MNAMRYVYLVKEGCGNAKMRVFSNDDALGGFIYCRRPETSEAKLIDIIAKLRHYEALQYKTLMMYCIEVED